MKDRIWLLIGVAVGIAIGLGGLAYFAGAAGSLSDTSQRLVGTGGRTLIHYAAHNGAPRRVVTGFTGLLAVLVPGVTALALMLAARGTLRARVVIGLLLAALGAAAFFYLPHGHAAGVALLAGAVAGIAVAAIGPLVAAALAALAALIATIFLPRLVTGHSVASASVNTLHQALFGTPGTPLWLRIAVLAVAALPFGYAARLLLT